MSDFDRYSLTIARWLTTLPEQRATAEIYTIPRDVTIEVQAHQMVTFAPGLKTDMPLVRATPPQTGKIALPFEGRCGPNRAAVLARDHPAICKKTGRWRRRKLLPERQGAWSNFASGTSRGRRSCESHALTVVRRNPLMPQVK
ncbi:hypothetical protein E5206_12485 [Arthrobacter sp. PAMC25564]|uniref:hypothetical protein n=1 Tax=Arthrobacter sp. PAMC25564 TaxID=2565366 RepID=UPI0010A1F97F|nr:hypothetical protein [Arthrobacter sp. PAMC25564]QCB97635.1 hypothetical protein E5206_12485 [Arthrobacter sp. PAMC25564]